jgi:CubicO group peptidase (beta-lactamase class C family)
MALHRLRGHGRRRSILSLVLVLAVAATPVLPAAWAAPPRIRPQALAHLIERGRASHSNALLVWQHGKLIAEEYFGTPPHLEPLMSSTKSIVALAVARLIDDGKVASFDQPVSDFYPEWKQGQKRGITLRHLLDHTSGLQNEPNTTVEIYPAPDAIQLALAAELSDPPGTRFAYNNKAVNLLAGIIAKAAGVAMDRYIDDTILRPLGITDAKWVEHDQAGHPFAMSGLVLTGAALLKIGRLVLGKGAVDGKRIVSERRLGELLAQSQPLEPICGLLWWRIPRWSQTVIDAAALDDMKQHGVDPATIAALATLQGRVFARKPEFDEALRQALGDGWVDRYLAAKAKGAKIATRTRSPDIVAYNTIGYLGEFLIVIPGADLVAVRLVDASEHYDEKTDGFDDFFDEVRALVEPGPT